jgi:hypothetical protein
MNDAVFPGKRPDYLRRRDWNCADAVVGAIAVHDDGRTHDKHRRRILFKTFALQTETACERDVV